MTRNHILKPPAPNPLNALIETRTIPAREQIPQHPLLPDRCTFRVLQASKQLRRPSRRRINVRLRILFGSGQIEEEIRLD